MRPFLKINAARLRWGIILTWSIVLISWTFTSPVGSSPDEDYHLASIYCAGGYKTGICEPSTYPYAKKVPSPTLNSGSCFVVNQFESANCQLTSGVLDTWELIDTIRLDYSSGDVLYYSLANLLVDDDIQVSVLKVRLLNIGIFLTLLVIFAIFSSIIQFAWLNVALLISLVPLGIYVISSVNSQSWQLTGLIFSWAFTYLALSNKPRHSSFLSLLMLSALLALIAINTRADALYFFIFYITILLFVYRKSVGIRRLITIGSVAACVLITSQMFGLSKPTNFVSQGFGDVQQPVPFSELLYSNLSNISEIIFGVFGLSDRPNEGYIIGGLGALDTPMPHVASLTMTLLFIGLISFAFVRAQSRLRWAMLISLLFYVSLPIFVLQRDNLLVGSYLQPRYLLPITFLLVALASMPKCNDRTVSKCLLWISVVAVTISHGLFLHAILRRYTVGNAGGYFSLMSDDSWWWNTNLSPYSVLIIATVSMSLLASMLAHLLLNQPEHSHRNNRLSEVIS